MSLCRERLPRVGKRIWRAACRGIRRGSGARSTLRAPKRGGLPQKRTKGEDCDVEIHARLSRPLPEPHELGWLVLVITLANATVGCAADPTPSASQSGMPVSTSSIKLWPVPAVQVWGGSVTTTLALTPTQLWIERTLHDVDFGIYKHVSATMRCHIAVTDLSRFDAVMVNGAAALKIQTKEPYGPKVVCSFEDASPAALNGQSIGSISETVAFDSLEHAQQVASDLRVALPGTK